MALELLAIDLEKRSFHCHGIDSDGIVLSRKVSRSKLLETIKELAPETVAMEACASAQMGSGIRSTGLLSLSCERELLRAAVTTCPVALRARSVDVVQARWRPTTNGRSSHIVMDIPRSFTRAAFLQDGQIRRKLVHPKAN